MGDGPARERIGQIPKHKGYPADVPAPALLAQQLEGRDGTGAAAALLPNSSAHLRQPISVDEGVGRRTGGYYVTD